MFFVRFVNTIVSIIKIILRSRFFLKNRFPKSETNDVIIMGNGPSFDMSLNKYPKELGSVHKIAVNFFGNSEVYKDLKPEYYILVDPGFWSKTSPQRFKDKIATLKNNLINQTTWAMYFFIPHQARKSDFAKSMKENRNIRIVYFNKTTINGFSAFNNICYRLKLGMPRPQNVLTPCLMIALNMNYKNIYLIGADHTWHQEIIVDEDNKVIIQNAHFYDKAKDIKKRIVLNSETGKPIKLYQQFEGLYYTFMGYHLIRNYANNRKSNIYNASEISFIDAFERKSLNHINSNSDAW